MSRPLTPYLVALLGVAIVAWLTATLLPVLGLASSALLFLLPVLLASTRGGIGPGLLAAVSGATAYNYFLLPPRFTFRIHGFDNIISVVVLVAVALVTSRLATRLQERRAEALARAQASEEQAQLAAILGKGEHHDALANGQFWLAERYGTLRLIGNEDELPGHGASFSSLDLSAAAWALHNGDITGHSTTVMPAAEWTFLPLAPRNRGDNGIAALARPATGMVREEGELAHIQQLVFLLGQAADRDALGRERRERERLEDSDRLRRALLASLAHDLRTPLTVITGLLESLAPTSAGAGEALDAARRLDRMMEDLLGAARLESGQLVAHMDTLDLVDAVGAACATVGLPPGVALKRAIPPDLPFVRADPILLHHILLNLLDNAARHARSQVMLAARQERGAVLLSICDDGPGIAPGERGRIFERFVRLEGSDRTQGSGLGLSIVKGFADAMRMSVAIGEAPEGGACFELDMPVPEGDAP